MASMKLKIIIHSANDLNNVKSMGTMSPYVIISMTKGAKFKTSSITNGGSNPVWSEYVEFNVTPDECMQENQVIIFDIYHGGIEFDRTIGQVKVSLKHLLLRYACGDKLRYPVTTTSGGEEGSILISYVLSIVSEDSDVVDDDPHESMASKKLMFRVCSAKNLDDVKLFGTMNPYARISMTGDTGSYRTPTDTNRGTTAYWNSVMEFDIDQDTCMQVITVEMFHDGTVFDRPIGKVLISLENLLLENAPGDNVACPVIGEGEGILIVSYTISFESKGSMAVDEPDEGVSIWRALEITLDVIDVVTTVMEYIG